MATMRAGVVGLLMALLAAPAMADSVALIVTAETYANVGALKNPRNDGIALTELLRGLGFSVSMTGDADLSSMRRALSRLKDDAEEADDVLIFFAGHGVSVDGQSRLLPNPRASALRLHHDPEGQRRRYIACANDAMATSRQSAIIGRFLWSDIDATGMVCGIELLNANEQLKELRSAEARSLIVNPFSGERDSPKSRGRARLHPHPLRLRIVHRLQARLGREALAGDLDLVGRGEHVRLALAGAGHVAQADGAAERVAVVARGEMPTILPSRTIGSLWKSSGSGSVRRNWTQPARSARPRACAAPRRGR